MLSSRREIKRVEDVRAELFNWREFYASELTVAAASDGGVSASGLAFLDRAAGSETLSGLADDALLIAFGYVSFRELLLSCSFVSRRFRALAKHPFLWRRFNLAHLVHSSGLPLRPISQRQSESFWIRQLAEGRFQATQLELQTATLAPRDVVNMLAAVPIVKHLDVSHCPTVDDEVLEILGETAPFTSQASPRLVLGRMVESTAASIRSLRLGFCSGFSGEVLCDLVCKTTWLRSLDVSGCDQLDCDHFRQLLVGCKLTELKCNATSVDHRCLECVEGPLALKVFHCASTPMNDAGLTLLGTLCPGLTDVAFSSCPITDTGLRNFLRGITASAPTVALETLLLDGCHMITDVSMRELYFTTPAMQRLHLDRTKVGASVFAELLQLPRLQSGGMSVSGCLYIIRDLPRNAGARRAVAEFRYRLNPTSRNFLQTRR